MRAVQSRKAEEIRVTGGLKMKSGFARWTNKADR